MLLLVWSVINVCNELEMYMIMLMLVKYSVCMNSYNEHVFLKIVLTILNKYELG